MNKFDMRYLLLLVATCMVAVGGFAQRTERDFIRRGNKLYEDSLFIKAEVEYRRALDANPQSMAAMYNLGNALLEQQKAEEALKQYQAAVAAIPAGGRNIALNETDREKLAGVYHNMGVLLQSAKQLDACIEAYKSSLRNNPHDHQTRYNLTVAMKQKKEQEQQQQEQQQQQQEQQEEKKEEQQQEQQNQQENQEQQEEQQQQQQQQEQQQEMSQENAEQMLNAIMQDEKDIQEKVKKAMQEVQPRKFEKDW